MWLVPAPSWRPRGGFRCGANPAWPDHRYPTTPSTPPPPANLTQDLSAVEFTRKDRLFASLVSRGLAEIESVLNSAYSA